MNPSSFFFFNSVECYDIQGERWYNSIDMNLRRCRAGVAVCKSVIYAVGGFNGALRVRSVAAFDSKKNEWKVGSRFFYFEVCSHWWKNTFLVIHIHKG